MTLFTVGCSFTFGEELPDPATQCWPALLAKQLNMPLINRARGGAGNEFMVKQVMQFVPKIKPDLVIVSWTSCGRVEFCDDDGPYDIWPGMASKHRASPPNQHRETLIRYITEHNNELHEHRRWLRQVVLLQDFLKLRGVDYYFLNNFDNPDRNKKFEHKNRGYTDLIDTSRFIGWPYEGTTNWTWMLPLMPRLHPGVEGHERISQIVHEFILADRRQRDELPENPLQPDNEQDRLR